MLSIRYNKRKKCVIVEAFGKTFLDVKKDVFFYTGKELIVIPFDNVDEIIFGIKEKVKFADVLNLYDDNKGVYLHNGALFIPAEKIGFSIDSRNEECFNGRKYTASRYSFDIEQYYGTNENFHPQKLVTKWRMEVTQKLMKVKN